MNTSPKVMALPRRCSGLTLIEVMVAIVIALILLAVTISVFVGNKRSYSEQEETSRMLENARYALDILSRDIRMANFGGGCANNKAATFFRATGLVLPSTVLQQSILEGYSNFSAQWFPSADPLPPGAADGGDGITTRYLYTGATLLVDADMATNSDSLTVKVHNSAELPKQNDTVTVTDCSYSEVFKITNNIAAPASYPAGGVDITLQHAASGNTTAVCSSSLTASGDQFCTTFKANKAFVLKGTPDRNYREYRYYIGDEDCDNATADTGARNLCLDDAGPAGTRIGQPVAEGIEYMRVLFGEDTTGDKIADVFTPANTVTNWANVTSVELALLARTPEPYGVDLDTKQYQLLDTTFTPNPPDRYRRRVFTATIQIRNQVFQ